VHHKRTSMMGVAAALNQPPAFNSLLASSSSVSALHLSCFLPDSTPLLPSAHLHAGLKITPHHSITHSHLFAGRSLTASCVSALEVSCFSPATKLLPDSDPLVTSAHLHADVTITPHHSIMHNCPCAGRVPPCLMLELPRSLTLLASYKSLADPWIGLQKSLDARPPPCPVLKLPSPDMQRPRQSGLNTFLCHCIMRYCFRATGTIHCLTDRIRERLTPLFLLASQSSQLDMFQKEKFKALID